MSLSERIAVIGTVATILSVFVAGYALWRQLNLVRRQMAIDHFVDYSQRYAEMLGRLPERVHDGASRLADLGDPDVIMPPMRDFFAACFAEWYLHERGLFDQGMWDLWRLGMRNALAKPAFREAWERIARDTHYGPAFRDFVAAEALAAVPGTAPRS